MEDEYSCLNITREEFREIYKGLPILESENLFFSAPKTDMEVLYGYLPSKLWRLNNIYTIVNKFGERIRFRMNRAQHKVYAASLRHPRLVILKSRQQGISTLWLVSFFDDAVVHNDYSIGLMAQGQDEASTLLERTKILWDTLQPEFKHFLDISIAKDNTKEFSLTNGSNIFIRTSFRSTTLQRLHISEMGKIANKSPEKAKETKTGTLQAIAQGNIAVIESTAEGDNMFKEIWDNAVLYSHALSKKDFMPIFLSWLDDPDCKIDEPQIVSAKQATYFAELEKHLNIKLTQEQKNFWVVQYRELGDKIYQEYPSTPIEAFMATKEGAYYAKYYFEWVVTHKREVTGLYDKNLEVQVAVDLGMDDTNVLNVFQTYTDQYRIIDEFADNGQKISYYTDWMKKQPWFKNVTLVILPHDAEVNELTSGKTRTQVFEEELKYDLEGNETYIEVIVLERTSNVNGDIERVRNIMSYLWIDTKCEFLKYCIINYKKEWDDKRERWRDKPDHTGEASHGADTLRAMVLGARTGTRFMRKGQGTKAVQTERIYNRARGDTDV